MRSSGLPLPGDAFEGLEKGYDFGNRILMSPYERQAKAAQAQQMLANAKQSTMLARLIGSVLGEAQGENNYSENSNSQQNKPLGISKEQLLKGFFGIPAETEEQKRQGDIAQKKAEVQTTQDIKSSDEIEDKATQLGDLKDLVNRAKEIFARRPDLTGRIAGGLGKAGLSSDKDIGTLHDIFGNIQSIKARIAGDRGGVGLIGWAQNIKPDITKPGPYNLSMLNSLDSGLNNQYKILHHRYKKKANKNLNEELGYDENLFNIQPSQPITNKKSNNESLKQKVEKNLGNKNKANIQNAKRNENGDYAVIRNGKRYWIPEKILEQALQEPNVTLEKG